jgi:hypothetical protein
MPHFGAGGARPPGPAQATAQALLAGGYAFDLVSDRLLANVQCDGEGLRAGDGTWQAVLVPETKYMPVETMSRLFTLAERGATILFHKRPPEDVPGFGRLDARRLEFQKRVKSLGGARQTADGVRVLAWKRGRLAVGDDLGRLLESGGVRRETLVERGLAYERRVAERGRIYFLLNRGPAEHSGWLPLATAAEAAAIFDPMSGASGLAALRHESGHPEVYLQLAPGEALVVRTFSAPVSGPAWHWWQPEGQPQPLTGKWTVKFLSGGPSLPEDTGTSELRSWTEFGGEAVRSFSGTARYRLVFAQPAGSASAWRLDLGRVAESARVRLNGREIATLIQPPFRVIIPHDQFVPQNTLEVLVTNLAANRIADLDRRDPGWKKFYNTNYPARLAENRGPDGNFTAARWTPRPSGLLGPVTLVPLSAVRPQ